MKTLIKNATFTKEIETKFGTMYGFKIEYEVNGQNKVGFYSSKSKDQKKFIAGQEAEFTEEVMKSQNGEWIKIKPVALGGGYSNHGKALKKEQSRYSGFSASYVKDMIVAGVIKPELTEEDAKHNDIVLMTLKERSFEVFEHMVNIDKTLEQ